MAVCVSISCVARRDKKFIPSFAQQFPVSSLTNSAPEQQSHASVAASASCPLRPRAQPAPTGHMRPESLLSFASLQPRLTARGSLGQRTTIIFLGTLTPLSS